MGHDQEEAIRDRQLSYSQVLCRYEVLNILECIVNATITLNITVGLFCPNLDILTLKSYTLVLQNCQLQQIPQLVLCQ